MILEVCSHHNIAKRMLKIPKFLLFGLDFVAKNIKEWFLKIMIYIQTWYVLYQWLPFFVWMIAIVIMNQFFIKKNEWIQLIFKKIWKILDSGNWTFFPQKLIISYVICQLWVIGMICKWGTHKNNTRNMCKIVWEQIINLI